MRPENMPDQTWFDSRAEILKAITHPIRLMILEELLRNPRCVKAIHEILKIQQPNISQHLTILRNAGIVESLKDGAYRCYYLRKPELVRSMFSTLDENWPEADIYAVRKKFKHALENHLQQQE